MNDGIYFNVKKDIGFESEVFEFKNNKEFNYVFFTCTGTGIGTGTYSMVNDSIHLDFKDIPKLENQTELKFVKSDLDSISINIKIVDYENGDELPAANCYFPKDKIGWTSDFNGKVNGTIIKTDSTRTLRIEFVGFEPVEIQISPSVSEVNGIIRLGNLWLYRQTDELRFKIIAKKNGRFTLARYEGKNITYKKINKDKVSEMVKNRTGKSYEHFIENK
jgi:hypothetical protein